MGAVDDAVQDRIADGRVAEHRGMPRSLIEESLRG
jgi:hypothetical protein